MGLCFVVAPHANNTMRDKANKLLENREELFYTLSSGFSRYKGWLFIGMNLHKNYLGLGVTNLSFNYNTKNKNYFLIEPGLSFQRNLLLKNSPFIAMNISFPIFNGYFDGNTDDFDGIIITKKGLNMPTMSVALGYEFKVDMYLIGLEISEKQKMNEVNKFSKNIQLGVSLSVPIGG